MSISHFFYVNSSLKEFPQELLDAVLKLIDNNKRLIADSEIDNEHILIALPAERPSGFYITTVNKDSYLQALKEVSFTFINYNAGRYNLIVCELALICKYYLEDKITITSDGFYMGIDYDWEKAEEEVKEKGFDIRLDWNENTQSPDFYIKGKKVLNEFDKDGKIFNSIFKAVKY